jgi:hypothetical protein
VPFSRGYVYLDIIWKFIESLHGGVRHRSWTISPVLYVWGGRVGFCGFFWWCLTPFSTEYCGGSLFIEGLDIFEWVLDIFQGVLDIFCGLLDIFRRVLGF